MAVSASDALLRQNVLVQRLASGEAGKFEKFLREIDRELRARLAGEDLTIFERARLERLLAGVDDMLKGVLDRFTQQLVLDLQEFAQHEAGVAARALASNVYQWRDDLWEGVKQGRPFKDEPALYRSMSRAEWDALQAQGALRPTTGEPGIYVTRDVDRLTAGGKGKAAYGGRDGGVIVRLRDGKTVKMASRTLAFDEIGVAELRLADVVAAWDAATGDIVYAVGGNAAPAKAVTTALAANADFEAVIPAVPQIRAAVLSNPLAVKGPDGGSLLEPFLRNWTAAERRAVTGAIRLAVFEGKTNQQIVQVLRGTRAAGYRDGLLATTSRHAESVVRTAVQHVSSVARAETFRVNADIVTRVRWLSTLDKRTCPRCGALDGKEFKPTKGPRPPLHPNCRCTIVPVLDDEFAGLDEGMMRPAKGAKGPGQVDAGVSYYEWLKRQPAAFQNAAIGKSRAKLLRDGGLSAQRFAALQMDKRFMPLTLEEMRALEPLAFQRAGL